MEKVFDHDGFWVKSDKKNADPPTREYAAEITGKGKIQPEYPIKQKPMMDVGLAQ